MRAHKVFIVIAYDISDDKRRKRVAKLLRQHGIPINMSVFECMLTESEFFNLSKKINNLTDSKGDIVVYYRMCMNCYTKIMYWPDKIRRSPEISGIV